MNYIGLYKYEMLNGIYELDEIANVIMDIQERVLNTYC